MVATDNCEIPHGKRHLACEIILDTETRLQRRDWAYMGMPTIFLEVPRVPFAGVAEGFMKGSDSRRWRALRDGC